MWVRAMLGRPYEEIVGRVAQSVQRLTTGLTVRGQNSGGGARFYAPVQTGPGAHPTSCTMGTGSFPDVKSSWSVTLTPSSAVVMRGQSYTSAPCMGRTACTELQCLYKGDLMRRSNVHVRSRNGKHSPYTSAGDRSLMGHRKFCICSLQVGNSRCVGYSTGTEQVLV